MENLTKWYDNQCDVANYNRLGVMAFVLLVQTCIIIPATLLAVSMNGNNTIEFVLIAIFSFSVLVAFLGDAPSKIFVPLFVVSTIVHLGIILVNVV